MPQRSLLGAGLGALWVGKKTKDEKALQADWRKKRAMAATGRGYSDIRRGREISDRTAAIEKEQQQALAGMRGGTTGGESGSQQEAKLQLSKQGQMQQRAALGDVARGESEAAEGMRQSVAAEGQALAQADRERKKDAVAIAGTASSGEAEKVGMAAADKVAGFIFGGSAKTKSG